MRPTSILRNLVFLHNGQHSHFIRMQATKVGFFLRIEGFIFTRYKQICILVLHDKTNTCQLVRRIIKQHAVGWRKKPGQSKPTKE